jgi:hypothetical protein
MARKESTTQFKESIPTIIGAGITEKWYFTHLQAKYCVRMKIRPRFFGKETVFTLEKKLMEVLKNGGRAIVVFDADVSTWNKAEKERLETMKSKYAKNNRVLLCDSMPSIEYWFLLHYVNTNRHFGTSKAVIMELVKHIKEFDKTETFLKNQKWVDDMSADGRLESAAQRAVAFGTSGESYTNVWKAMQELHIVELEASQESSGNRIDKLVEQDMLFFILGTVVSADSLVDAESCEKALKIVRELKEDLPLSKLKDDKKLKTRLDEAEQIIMCDLETFQKPRSSSDNE